MIVEPIYRRRFYDRFIPEPNTGCWLWLGGEDRDGYGRMHVYPWGTIGAHRASYLMHVGLIPKGRCVCHTCDVPCCVNPGHLWIGTNEENTADRHEKGRSAKGSAKITPDDVLDIRDSSLKGVELAGIYGVTPTTITQIRKWKTWREVGHP